MARILGFNPESKAIPASSTVRWSQNELNNDKVVAFVIAMEGNGGQLQTTGLSRIRVKAGGDQIADWSIGHLRSYLERYSSRHFAYGATDTRVIVPFGLFDLPTEAQQDQCQFPMGQAPTLELEFGSAGDGTGSVSVGWIRSTVTPKLFPRVSNTALNIAASTSNASHTLTQRGRFRAMSINRDGLDRLVMSLNGNTRWANTQGNGTASKDLLSAATEFFGITSSNDYMWINAGQGVQIGEGKQSQLEVDTGSGWGGVSESVSVVTLHPQQLG